MSNIASCTVTSDSDVVRAPECNVQCNMLTCVCKSDCGVWSVDTGCDKRNIIQIDCITYHQGVRSQSEGNAILATPS